MADPPVGDYEAHVRLWTAMFQTLLGCSPSQVASWAENFRTGIADENSLFYNQPPEYYVARNLMPQRFALDAASYVQVVAAIQGVLQQRTLTSASALESIDWHSAKGEVDTILRTHGKSLANVANERSAK